MLDDRRLVTPHDHAYRIEPAMQPGPAVPPEPEAGNSLDLASFPGGDRFQRVPKAGAGSRLYLDERHHVITSDDQVDFAVAEAVVACQDRVPLLAEIARGELLTQNPQVAPRGHSFKRVWASGLGHGGDPRRPADETLPAR